MKVSIRGFTSALMLIMMLSCFSVRGVADTIDVAANGVTDFFGNQNGVADSGDATGLLFDEVRTGGGDSAAAMSFSPSRFLEANGGANDNWATGLVNGTAGIVRFTGIGVALRGGTTATEATLNIVYLGADGNVGGTDDVLVGSATDSLNYSTTNEYAWRFTDPFEFSWDGQNNRFRFELFGNDGNLRFKQRPANESPSGQGGITLSVGGTFTAIPEPGSGFALIALAVIGTARRQRT